MHESHIMILEQTVTTKCSSSNCTS